MPICSSRARSSHAAVVLDPASVFGGLIFAEGCADGLVVGFEFLGQVADELSLGHA